MKKKTALFFCAGMFLCSGLYAQYTPPGLRDSAKAIPDSIKTVTITATRTEKDVMDVGRSVTVISSEQIKQASCNTLAELLSQQEGIFIDGAGQNPGVIQTVFMRGADDNSTTIMIDGVPITDPSTDAGELDMSELSLANIDKIEIVRGSHSTLYGSSSIGGVINIITKKAYTPGFHVSASGTGGEFGSQTSMFDGSVLVNYTLKNGLYLTGGYHAYSDKGLNATVDTFTHPLSYQMNPDRDNFQKSEPFAKIGFYNKHWDAFFEYKNVIQTADADEGAFSDLQGANTHFVRDHYVLGINYKFDDRFSVQYTGSESNNFRVYKQALDTDQNGLIGSADDFYKALTYTDRLQLTYDFKGSHFILGADHYKASMDESTYFNSVSYDETFASNLDSIKPEETSDGVYAQADINGGTFAPALKPFSLLIGGRYTKSTLFGNNTSYEINPYYKVNANTTLYISFSTGFKTPSLYQFYAQDKYGDNPATSVTIGNQKLTPETSTSFEAGIKRRVSDNLFFTLAWFETVVNNHIDYVALWDKNRSIDSLGYGYNLGDTYINLGQEITQGFELNIFLKLSPKLDVSGNISLLSSILKYIPNNVDTTQTHGNWVQIYDGGQFLNQTPNSTGLLRRPGSLANFSIVWHPVQKLSLSLRARYVGTRYDAQYNSTLGPYGALGFVNVGDYTLLDAFVSYDITKQFSVTARGENLFNTSYSEILGYTTLGRSFYLNLRFAF